MKKICGLIFVFSFCSSFLFAQSETQNAIKEISDLQYLDTKLVVNDTLQRLNLVLPENIDSFPLMVWIGGGAWSYVNRHMEMNLARRFAENGIAVASVGHRLSSALWQDSTHNGGAQHPDHIEDVAAAFKWLYDHASEYGYDQEKIFVGGFSSGAHLAALLCLDEKYLKKHGLSKKNVRGVIPVSGTYDVQDYYNAFINGSRPELAVTHVQSVFGESEAEFKDASPTSYLDNLSVPMLLLTDNYVYRYTNFFEEALAETEFRNFDILYVYQLSHGDLWRNLAAEKSTYRNIITDFIGSNTPSSSN